MTDQNEPDPADEIPEEDSGEARNPREENNPEEENEVLRAARAAKEQQARAIAGDKSRLGWKTAAAAGIGIGSAALLAALMYSRRDRD